MYIYIYPSKFSFLPVISDFVWDHGRKKKANHFPCSSNVPGGVAATHPEPILQQAAAGGHGRPGDDASNLWISRMELVVMMMMMIIIIITIIMVVVVVMVVVMMVTLTLMSMLMMQNWKWPWQRNGDVDDDHHEQEPDWQIEEGTAVSWFRRTTPHLLYWPM